MELMPWQEQPVVAIPDPLNAVRLRILPVDEFAGVLRSNLVPVDGERATWLELWITLAFNNDLAERAFDVLEEWLDLAEDLAGDDPQQVPAQLFAGRCQHAWNRLTRIRERDTRARIPDPGTTAGRFAAAIAAHREKVGVEAGTVVDRALWAAPANILDRGHKRGATNQWDVEPTMPLQLIASVEAHRAVVGEQGDTPRAADRELWSLLRTSPGQVRR